MPDLPNPSPVLRQNARERPANPIPDDEWNKHRQRIEDLYKHKRMRLQDVIQEMQKNHEFEATLAQYNKQLRRWGIVKNTKRDHQVQGYVGEPPDKRQCARSVPRTNDNLESDPNLATSAGIDIIGVNTTSASIDPDMVQLPPFQTISSPREPGSLEHGNREDYQEIPGGSRPGTQPEMPAWVTSFREFPVTCDPALLSSTLDGFLNGSGNQENAGTMHYNLSYEPCIPNTMNIVPEGIPQRAQPSPLPFTRRSRVHTTIRQPIHQAAQAGNLRGVEFLLEVAPQCANVKDGSDVTPIWIAAQGGYLQIVNLLLGCKVDVDVPTTESHRTAIHQAAQQGHLEVVKRLLEYGANPDPRDESGISPLWSAAQQGHSKIVQVLIEKGASIETVSQDGKHRPIHQAAQSGHVEVVRVLLQAGAEANPERTVFHNEAPSPFWLAAQDGNVSIGKLLIDRGANLEYAVGSSKRRPLHQATLSGHTDFVDLLIENQVNVDSREEDGWTPLMMAAQQGYLEIVEKLLGSGANPNIEEKDAATAIWLAAQQGHIKVVEALHKKGAKVLPTKGSERRPIHQAAQNGHLEVVEFLINECGEDVNAQDSKAATPLLLASQGEGETRVDMMVFLYKKGAKAII